MSSILLKQQLGLLQDHSSLKQNHASKKTKRKPAAPSLQPISARQKKLLIRSHSKFSTVQLGGKTGHSETDEKAHSLQRRKEMYQEAQRQREAKERAALSPDELALLRFRETSMSLLKAESDIRANDFTDQNTRLLLLSESFSKRSTRSKYTKKLIQSDE